jgi:hypothetical protein
VIKRPQLDLLSTSEVYWHAGADAERLVRILREVAATIEQVTGLTAYDPQAAAPLLGEGEYSAARTFDCVVDANQRNYASSAPRPEATAPLVVIRGRGEGGS